MTVGFCCFWLLLDDFDVCCASEGEDDAGAFFLSIDFVLCGFPDVVVKEGGGGVCFSMAFFFLSVFSVFPAFFIFSPFFSFFFAFVSLCEEGSGDAGGSGVGNDIVSPPSRKVDLVVVDLMLWTW